jgi:quercetin dioxygenase-like cupin family protein
VLKVIELDRVSSEDVIGGIFVDGTVKVKTLIDKQLGAKDMKAAIVSFPPGARTKLHTHSHEQILYILSGKGIVANEQEEHIATPGQIFLVPAGEKHWHGATRESSFSHLYIYNSQTKTTY